MRSVSHEPYKWPIPPSTGWKNGLMQDECQALAQWFSTRLDARAVVRRVCAEIAATYESNSTTKEKHGQGNH